MKTDKAKISKQWKDISLKKCSPKDRLSYKGSKEEALQEIQKLTAEIADLQDLFAANAKKGLLIVLQGMDTSGKDGTVAHVFSLVNPQGVRVACFKAPNTRELTRDYLWRIHFQIPAKGEMVIFNRSHYEDVLAVRVHNLVPKEVWKKRYEHINNFEQMLVDEGTVVLKFFLHIDKQEQTRRLKERFNTPGKQWKLSMADMKERDFWKDYQEAYEEVLKKTSTPHAPWYIVPANDKWFRNLFISKVIVDTLKSMNLETPKPNYDMAEMKKIFEKEFKSF